MHKIKKKSKVSLDFFNTYDQIQATININNQLNI